VNFRIITFGVNGLLMIAMPIGLAIYLTRKFKQGWRLFWIGATTFIFSQVLHIPFNTLINPFFNQFIFIALPLQVQNIFLSVFFGMSAGLFEELSRFAMYKWWVKDARSWSKALLAGAGHGGVEAIILGLLVFYIYIQMLIVRGMDISTFVSLDKVESARNQIQTYWSTPWFMTMVGALERLFTIPLHLACSVLVLQTFTRKNLWWLALAIIFHALVDGVIVFVSRIGFPALTIEGIIGLFAIVSMLIVFSFRQADSPGEPSPTPIRFKEIQPEPINETKENLEKTQWL
jgi:uncharacterized membrane protein YhfC